MSNNLQKSQLTYLSVIIPAYNEENRIEATLRGVNSYLSKQNYVYEIIVVIDGSKDRTVEITSQLSSEIPNLRFIDNKKNQGKGWAVRCGMLNAIAKTRLFMDADNSTTVGQIEHMFSYLEDGFDVVIGSRRVDGAAITVHQSIFRERLGQIFNLIVRIITGLKINDTQAGFKAFTSVAAEQIFSLQTIRGWAFDVELLVIAQKLRFNVKEFPIVWRNDERSHVKLKGMIRMLLDLIRIRLNLWLGVYNQVAKP
jgi:dolichyl-phosphate beta-glucosyltransferase